MKVFLLAPNEDWIVDKFVNEFYEYNVDISTQNPYEADVVWLVADWAWDKVPYKLLEKKKVITSVHHLVPNKFDDNQLQQFRMRDKVTDLYHVPCKITQKQVEDVLVRIGSTKPVVSMPFWVNPKTWNVVANISDIRKKYDLSDSFNTVYAGSFQRDTEGYDLRSPKLEKGADLLCNMIETLDRKKAFGERKIEVILGGWRRQYVMNRLEQAKIAFRYFERPEQPVVNELYSLLDLYIVAARYEGGPQAVVECAATHTPIVSTHVGLAPEILHPKLIFDAANEKSFLDATMFADSQEALEYNFSSVEKHFLPSSFENFRNLLSQL